VTTTAPAKRHLRWIAPALTLVLTASAAHAQALDWVLPDSRMGVRTAPLLLLTRPDVQAELQLTREQTDAVRRAVVELWSRAAALRGKSDTEALAGRRAIDEDQRHRLETLLSEEQQSRLLQLDLQWEGPFCLLSRGWVASWVGLTPEDRRALSGRVEAELKSAARTPGAYDSARKVAAERIVSNLSPDQRARWTQLIGTGFRFGLSDARVGQAGGSVTRK
jgi:hypothetical protein